MFIEGLLNRGSLPVLEKVMNFTQARHEVLVNNITNFDTVDYQAKDLPVGEFYNSLRKAVDKRDRRGAGSILEMPNSRHLRWARNGRLTAKPDTIKNNNILFHDQNNRFVEKQMSEMAKNALMHNITAEMLKGQYNQLQLAVRGKF